MSKRLLGRLLLYSYTASGLLQEEAFSPFLPLSATLTIKASIYIYLQPTLLGKSRVHRLTHLRTDGVLLKLYLNDYRLYAGRLSVGNAIGTAVRAYVGLINSEFTRWRLTVSIDGWMP